jgi:hypothetical protein
MMDVARCGTINELAAARRSTRPTSRAPSLDAAGYEHRRADLEGSAGGDGAASAAGTAYGGVVHATLENAEPLQIGARQEKMPLAAHAATCAPKVQGSSATLSCLN